MTKVNYFEAEGKNSKKEISKQIFYARSKKDVMNIAKHQGFFTDAMYALDAKSLILCDVHNIFLAPCVENLLRDFFLAILSFGFEVIYFCHVLFPRFVLFFM